MPLGIGNGYAFWPPMATEEELTTAALTPDGKHVQGWVQPPATGVWRPQELLWLPPNAVKSTDLDEIGRVVDVTPGLSDDDLAFVTAETARHNRYLEALRDKVRAGALKLTAFLAKMLGLPFDEDGVQLAPQLTPSGRPLAAYKAAAAMKADLEATITRTGVDVPDDRITTIAANAAERYAATGNMNDALNSILRAVRSRPPRIDADTGLPIVDGRS